MMGGDGSNPDAAPATPGLAPAHVIAQAHDCFGSTMPACKQPVAVFALHVIASNAKQSMPCVSIET